MDWSLPPGHVSIRFKVRDGFRQSVGWLYKPLASLFQSALRFAVVSDSLLSVLASRSPCFNPL